MSISGILEKGSHVLLHFEDCLAAPHISLSIVFEVFGFVEEFGGFVCLESIESLHCKG